MTESSMDSPMQASPFKIKPNQSTVLIVDGMTAYAATRMLRYELDFSMMRDYFETRSDLLYAMYVNFIAEETDEHGVHNPVRPLVDYLMQNGWRTWVRPAQETLDAAGRRRFRHGIAGAVPVEMMQAAMNGVRHIVLVGGDLNYVRAVEAVQALGCKVTVVSTRLTSPPMVAVELRFAADHFVDLGSPNVKSLFLRRDIAERQERQAGLAAAPAVSLSDAMTDPVAEIMGSMAKDAYVEAPRDGVVVERRPAATATPTRPRYGSGTLRVPTR